MKLRLAKKILKNQTDMKVGLTGLLSHSKSQIEKAQTVYNRHARRHKSEA